MPKGTLEIGVYEPPIFREVTGAEQHATTSSYSAHQSRRRDLAAARYGPSTLGALVSILLHALVITGIVWGGGHSRAPSPRRADVGALGRADGVDRESTMELVSIEETESAPTSSLDLSSISLPTLATMRVDPSLANVSIPSLSDEDTTGAEHAVGDSATSSSALLGRYFEQIDARIERAWLRPREPVKKGAFSCRVRIEQDASGVVKEITLERCNGDARWKMSLIHAIQLASPLPAPPDPKVFKRLLRLDFHAQPYSPGASEDLYESPMIAGAHSVIP